MKKGNNHKKGAVKGRKGHVKKQRSTEVREMQIKERRYHKKGDKVLRPQKMEEGTTAPKYRSRKSL